MNMVGSGSIHIVLNRRLTMTSDQTVYYMMYTVHTNRVVKLILLCGGVLRSLFILSYCNNIIILDSIPFSIASGQILF